MALDRKIVKAAIVAGSIAIVLIAAVFLTPKAALDRILRGPTNDTLELVERAAEFAAALGNGRSIKLYHLFNPIFRDEISFHVFDSALKSWQGGKTIGRVATTHVEVQGMSGLISSHVYFQEPRERPDDETLPDVAPSGRTRPRPGGYDFLFQTWLRAAEGWELMWISKILDPIAMDYGRRDTADLRQILQLALDEIVTREGIERALGLKNPSKRLILVSQGVPPVNLKLPEKRVIWLSKDSIDFYQQRYDIVYYIEILPLRVIGNIAVGAFDVVPVTGGSGATSNRPRSIKLFFRRTDNKWGFASYGSRW